MIALKRIFLPISLLASNAAWLFSAELLAKLSRIITIIVLAFSLSPTAYGTAMLALACHDILALLLRAGAGTQVIRCKEAMLPSYARNGASIQWAICIILAATQYYIAHIIAQWYDNQDLILLLKVMAMTYLCYPWVSINVFLLQRTCQMRYFSIRNGLCVTAENLSIALFAWWQCDFMAVAYGKVVFSLLWLIVFWRAPVKHYGIGCNPKVLRHLLRMSRQLVSIELLRALRLHTDTIIAAKVMSPELFGLYSFAKNAGIGLSQSISNVFNSALFPFLCKLQRQKKLEAQRNVIYLVAVMVGFIFVFQALLAPIYMPILFGQKWLHLAPVVSVMCLIALPTVIVDTCCCFERAQARLSNEIVTRFIYLLFFLIALLLTSPTTPMLFAIAMLIGGALGSISIYFGHHIIAGLTQKFTIFHRRKYHEY